MKQEPGVNNSNNEYGPNSNPLVHLSDSVNSLDPLNAMEKSLNDQVILKTNFYCFRKSINKMI